MITSAKNRNLRPRGRPPVHTEPTAFALRPLAAHVRRACLPASVVLGLHAGAALAGPQGGQVVAGQGSINNPNASTTVIKQNSPNLAIDWTSFNIGANELVRFNQPNANASALNRIFDQNPSQIFGQLTANGRVLLMNPNGVFFGPNAKVNVNALVAAGGSIGVDDFMAGRYNLETWADADGFVINKGVIEAADGGSVTLAGKTVSNEGVILANAGQVNLLSGSKFTLDFDGDGLMQFAIDEAVLDNVQQLDAAVSNTGTIDAPGGEVIMAARVAQDVFTHAVNNAGVVKAGRVENKGGVIRLVGMGPDASVINTGVLTADASSGDGGSVELVSSGTTIASGEARISAASDSGSGGSVHVLGERVGLIDTVVVDVSGHLGGGELLIGGDFQGKNPDIQNAAATYVGKGVTLTADALTSGEGGKVIVWSDQITRYYGSISATGGSESGNGGFAEVSGKDDLQFSGSADLTAANGDTGTLLLDPLDLVIQGGATNAGGGAGTDDDLDTNGTAPDGITFATNAGNTTTITEEALEDLTANVELEAANSITVSGTFGNDSGNGEGTAAIVRLGPDLSLTMRTRNAAGEGSGGIDLTGVTVEFQTQGTGGITLETGTDGGDAGSAPIVTGKLTTINAGGGVNGGITIDAEGSVTINGDLTTANSGTNIGAISITGGDQVTINNAITTGDNSDGDGADITIVGQNAVAINAALLTGTVAENSNSATSGTISVTSNASTITTNGSGSMTTGTSTVAGNANGQFATTGNITLQADGLVTLGAALLTGNATDTDFDDATTGDISVTSTNGGITSLASASLTTGDADVNSGGNGDDATSGAITLSAAGDISLADDLTTGTAEIDDSNAVATTGAIMVTTTAGGITGDANAALTTGQANADGSGGDHDVVSGLISLDATGAIQLGATDALRTGDAVITNANSNNDTLTVGNITIVKADSFSSDGSTGQVDVRVGTTDDQANGTNAETDGELDVTADAAAGGIFVTTAEPLIIASLTTTGGGNVVVNSTSSLDADNDAGADISTDGDVTLTGTGIGANQQIDITGNAGGGGTLTLTIADGDLDIEELTNDHFGTINLTINDGGGSTNFDINFSDADVFNFSDDGTTLDINNGELDTSNSGRTVNLTTTGLDVSVVNGAVDTGAGDFTLVTDGTLTTANSDNNADITGDNLDLTATSIGSGGSPVNVEATTVADLTATSGDIFVDSNANLTVNSITTTNAQADTVNIATTGSADLTLDGTGGYTNVATDDFVLTSANLLTLQTTNLTIASLDAGSSGTTSIGIDISTDGGGDIDFVDANDVQLTKATVTLDTDASGGTAGDVLFGSTPIEDDTNGRSLVIDATSGGTSGAVTLGDVGATNPLAALTVSGDTATLNGTTINTDDGNVDFTGVATSVTLANNVTIDTDASGGTAGDVLFDPTPILDDGSGRDLVIDATSAGTGGAVTLGQVGTDGTEIDVLTVSGLSLTLNGDIDATGDVTFNPATTVTAAIEVDANTATLAFNNTLSAGGNALILTADEIDFANTVSGTSTITLQPGQDATNVGVNDGGVAGGDLDLSTSDLNQLQNGFTNIIIGRNTTGYSGTVTVGAFTFDDSLTLRAGTGAATGDIDVTGALATTAGEAGSITFIAGDMLILENDVSTDDADIDATGVGTVQIAAATVTLDTDTSGGTAGDVLFGTTPIEDDTNGRTLVIDTTSAGTDGDVTLGNVGVTNRLAALTVSGGDLLLNGTTVQTDEGNVDFTGLTSVTLGNDVSIDTETGGQAAGNVLFGTAIVEDDTNGRSLDIDATSAGGDGSVTLGNVGVTNRPTALTVSGGIVTLNGGTVNTDDGNIDFTGATGLLLTTDTSFDSDTSGGTAGDILFGTAGIDANAVGHTLSIDASSAATDGAVSLGALGAGNALGSVTVTTAGLTSLNGAIDTDDNGGAETANVDFSGATGGIQLNTTVIIDTDDGADGNAGSGVGDVDLSGSNLTANTARTDGLTIDTGTADTATVTLFGSSNFLGAVTITDTNTLQVNNALSAASFTQTTGGGGGTTFSSSLTTTGGTNQNGGNVSITTDGAISTGSITANAGSGTNAGENGGNVTLTSNSSTIGVGAISANGGNGASNLNGGTAGNITLNGDGAVTLNGAINASGGDEGGGGSASGAGGTVTINSTTANSIVTTASSSITAQNGQESGGGTTGNGGTVALNDPVSGTSLTIRTNNASGDLSAGGQVDLSDVMVTGAMSITAGTIDLNGTGYQSTTGGAISFTGAVRLNGGTVSIQSAGAAPDDISFLSGIFGTGTVNGEVASEQLTLNAGSLGAVLVEGAIGGTTPLNKLTVASAASATFGAISLETLTTDGTGASRSNVVLDITADAIVFNGTVQSDGTGDVADNSSAANALANPGNSSGVIILQPILDTTPVLIGQTAAPVPNTGLNVSNTSWANIADDFVLIRVGNATNPSQQIGFDMAGGGKVTLIDPTEGRGEITADGSSFSGDGTLFGNVTLTISDDMIFGIVSDACGGVACAAGNFTFANRIRIGEDATPAVTATDPYGAGILIDSAGINISFALDVDSVSGEQNPVYIDAGGDQANADPTLKVINVVDIGSIIFRGDLGATDALGDVTIGTASNFDIADTSNADAGTTVNVGSLRIGVNDGQGGAETITGSVLLASAGSNAGPITITTTGTTGDGDGTNGTATAASTFGLDFLAEPVSLRHNITFDIANVGTSQINGNISEIVGGLTLTKDGAGLLTLNGSNSYTGKTTISGGTLNINSDDSLGTAPGVLTADHLTLDGGTLQATTTFGLSSLRGITLTANGGGLAQFNSLATLTVNPVIAGSAGGDLTISGNGIVTLVGANTYDGNTIINSGTLSISSDGNLGAVPGAPVADSIQFGGGTLRTTAGITLNANRGITLNTGGGTIETTAGTLTYNGIITGASADDDLTKTGAATLSLGGANTYAGATNLNAGTLSISSDANLGTAPGAPVVDQLTFNGGTLLTAGTFTIDSNRGVTLNGAGTFSTGAGTITYDGIIAGAAGNTLTKSNSGTLSLGGVNTYDGATSVTGGILEIRNASGLGTTTGATTVSSGASLQLNNVVNVAEAVTISGGGVGSTGVLRGIGTSSLDGAVTVGSSGTAIAATAGSTFTINGVIDDGGGLFNLGTGGFGGGTGQTGTVVFAGANTHSGTTFVLEGTLQLDNNSALGVANTTNVNLGSTLHITDGITITGETLRLGTTDNPGGAPTLLGSGTASWTGGVTLLTNSNINVAAGGSLTVSGAIGDGGGGFGITKLGTGSLTLAGANGYAGATAINAGTVEVTNNTGLGSTAAGTSVTSGATLDLNGVAVGAEALTLNGTGIGGAGALLGTNLSSLGGGVTLGSDSTIGGTGTLTLNGVITDGGSSFRLTKVGTGTLVLTAANTYDGGTTFNGGVVRISSDGNLGNVPALTADHLQANGGTLETTASFTLNANRGLTLNGDFTFDVNAGTTLTYNGAITGGTASTTTLFKIDTGILSLGGSSDYDSETDVTAGTLRITSTDALGSTNDDTVVSAGATLEFNNATNVPEALILNGTGVGGNGALLGNGTSSQITGNVTLASDVTVGGTGTLSLGGVVDESGGARRLTKVGAGTITLANASNSYSGGTTFNAGTVAISADGNLGTAPGAPVADHLLFGGGTLRTTATLTIDSNRGVTLNAGGGTFNVDASTTTTYGGIIAGAAGGALNKAGGGTLLLSGANTYDGQTNVQAGALQITNNSALGASTGAATDDTVITGSAGARLELNNVALPVGEDITLNGFVFDAPGSLRAIGAATSTVGGTVIHNSGNTLISAAPNSVLQLNGSLINNTGLTFVVGGVSSGGGSPQVGETGTVIFAGDNSSFSAPILVAEGTLRIDSASGLGTTAAGTNVETDGTLQLNSVDIGAEQINLNSFDRVGDGGTATLLGTDLGTTNAPSLSGNISLGNGSPNTVIQVDNTTLTLSGVISGSGGFTKQGTGTLILAGGSANTYTGVTTISAGTVELQKATGLGADTDDGAGNDTTVASGAALNINNVAVDNEAVTLSGTGVGGTGALIGTGTASLVGGVTLAGDTTVNVDATDTLDLSGVIDETGGSWRLTKIGTGTLTLSTSGNNTYSGGTTFNGGVVSISKDSHLGTAPGAPVADHLIFGGGTLQTTAGFTLNANRGTTFTNGGGGGTFDITTGTVTYNGIIAGANAADELTKTGAGKLVLGGANSYAGATNINGGTLSISADNNLGTAPGAPTADHLVIGGTLETTATFELDANRLVTINTGGATFDVNSSTTLTYNGVISDGTATTLTKTDAGTLVLGGANTYTGLTTVNAGILRITNASGLGTTAAGTTVASGATLELNGVAVGAETLTLNGTGVGSNGALLGTGATPSLNGDVTLATTSTIAAAAGTEFTLNGVISGGGGAVLGIGGIVTGQTGTVILTGTNTYAGQTEILEGTARLTNAAGLGASTANTFIDRGATLELNNVTNVAEPLRVGTFDLAGAGNPTILGVGTSSLTGTVSLELTAATNNFNVTPGSTLTLDGVVSSTADGATLRKIGGGTLTLTAANTYASATQIGGGTLIASNADALGTAANGTTVESGATLNINSVTIANEAVTINGIGVGGNGALFGTGAAQLSTFLTLGSDASVGSSGADTLTIGGVNTTSSTLTKVGTGGLTVLGTTDIGGLVLTDASLAQFQGNVNVGNGGTGTITTGATGMNVEFLDGVDTTGAATFDNTGYVQIGDAGGDSSSFGGAVTHTVGNTLLAGTVLTSDDALSFDTVTLLSNVGIDINGTGAGTNGITLGAITGSGRTLNLDAGNETISLAAAGSAGNELTALNVLSSGNVTFSGDVFANGQDYSGATGATVNGAIRFDADAGAGDINFGTANLTRTAGTDTVTFTAGAADAITLANVGTAGGRFSTITVINANLLDIGSAFSTGDQSYTATTIDLNGTSYNSSGGALSFTGAVNLVGDPIGVTSGSGAADTVTFSSTIDGGSALTVTAGSGDVSIGGAAGGTTPLTSLDIASAGQIDVNDVTTTGAQSYNGTGIDLNGTSYMSTTAGAISFTGPVLLNGGTTTVATAGGAASDDISFSSTIDGGSAGQQLTLMTGDGVLASDALGDVTVSGAIGGTTRLDVFTVAEAASATLDAISMNVVGQTDVVITIRADEVDFTGGTGSIIGTGTGDVGDSSDPLTLPGTSQGQVVVATAADPTVGGDIIIGGTETGSEAELFISNTDFAAFGDDWVVINYGHPDAVLRTDTIDVRGSDMGPDVLIDPVFVFGKVSLDAPSVKAGTDGNIILNGLTFLKTTNITLPSITFNGTVLIAADDITFTATSGNIVFNGLLASQETLAPANPERNSLNLNAAGDILFQGNVGSTFNQSGEIGGPLGDLTIEQANSVTFADTGVTTVDMGGTPTMGNLTEFNIGSLTVQNTGTFTFGANLANLTITGQTHNTGNDATSTITGTTVGIDLDGASNVVFGATTLTLDTSVNNSPITLPTTGDVDGAAADSNALVVNAGTGVASLGGVGQNARLTSLDVTGGTINLYRNIDTNGAIGFTGSTVLNDTAPIVLTSNTAGVTFDGTVDGAEELQVNAATAIAFNGVVGGTTPLTELTASGNSVSLQAAVTTDGDQEYSGTTSVNGNLTANNGDLIFESQVNIGANGLLFSAMQDNTIDVQAGLNANAFNLTLEADEIGLAGTVQGTGNLILRQKNAGSGITIGGPLADDEDNNLDLDDNDLAALADGFASITIGRSNTTGTITVAGNSSFADPVTLQTDSGDIDVNAQLSGTGNGSFAINTNSGDINVNSTGGIDAAGPGGISLFTDTGTNTLDGDLLSTGGPVAIDGSSNVLNAAITTSSQTVTITGPVDIDNNASIDTTNGGGSAGADVLFNNAVNDQNEDGSLTVDAGGAAVTFSADIGGTDPLGALDVTGGAGITVQNVNTINSGGGSGDQTYTGPVTANGDLTGEGNGASLVINGSLNESGPSNSTTLDFQNGTVNITGNADVLDVLTQGNQTFGGTLFAGDLTSTNGGVQVAGLAVVNNVDTRGDQSFDGGVNANILTAANGDLSVGGDEFVVQTRINMPGGGIFSTAGTVNISGPVSSRDDQTYDLANNPVQMDAVSLTTTGNGQNIIITGDASAFLSGDINSAGSVRIDVEAGVHNVTSTGNQTYNALLHLNGTSGGSAMLSGANLQFAGLDVGANTVLSSDTNVFRFTGPVTGTAGLAINPTLGTDLVIDNQVQTAHFAPAPFATFGGHLVIGGILDPLDGPSSQAPEGAVATVNARTVTIGEALSTQSDITILASEININDNISAGGPGGRELFLFASGQDSSTDGNINGPATGEVLLEAGNGFMIAAGLVENGPNMVLDFNAGNFGLAQSTSQDPNFSPASNAQGITFEPNDITWIPAFNLSLNVVQATFLNLGALLTQLSELGFLDVSVFETELELIGQIGTGVAMDLTQCEELEGCAPTITLEELDTLITDIEARVAELERRKLAGDTDPKIDELLAGYREELENFKSYRERLAAYMKAQEQDEFLEEFEFEELEGGDFEESDETMQEAPAPAEEPAPPAEEPMEEGAEEMVEPPVPETQELQQLEQEPMEEPAEEAAPGPVLEDEFDLEDQLEQDLEPEPQQEKQPDLEEQLEDLMQDELNLRVPVIPAGVSTYQWVDATDMVGRVLWTGDMVLPGSLRRY